MCFFSIFGTKKRGLTPSFISIITYYFTTQYMPKKIGYPSNVKK